MQENEKLCEKNILHYYLSVLKRNNSQNMSINNIINTMSLSRNGKICSELFLDLDLSGTNMFDLDFSNNTLFPTSFLNCKISIDSLMLRGHRCSPQCIAISKDGHYFASGTSEKEGVVCIWDLYNHKLYRKIRINLLKYPIPIECLSFSEDNKRLFIGVGAFLSVYEYDIETEQIIFGLELVGTKNREIYSRVSIKQPIMENEEQYEKRRKDSEDLYSFIYEAISWDKASMAFVSSFHFDFNDTFSKFIRRGWDEGGKHFYYSLKITSIECENSTRIRIIIEVEKRMLRLKYNQHHVLETGKLTMLIDKKDMCVEYRVSALKKANVDITQTAAFPITYEFERYIIQKTESFKYAIIDKKQKSIQEIRVGFYEVVFVYFKDGYLISHLDETDSIIWDTHTLSVSEIIPLQFPSIPIRRRSQRSIMDKMGVLSPNRKCLVFDKCISYLRNVTNKLDDKKDFEEFSCMIDEYVDFFTDESKALLPWGWIEETQMLYIHYRNYLFIIDANSNSLIQKVKISRNIDVYIDCKYQNIISHSKRIRKIYLSPSYKMLAILYDDPHAVPQIEIVNLNYVGTNKLIHVSNKVNNACFLSDDAIAIGTYDNDRAIILYDIITGDEIKRLYHLTNLHIQGCEFKCIDCDDTVTEILRQQGGILNN